MISVVDLALAVSIYVYDEKITLGYLISILIAQLRVFRVKLHGYFTISEAERKVEKSLCSRWNMFCSCEDYVPCPPNQSSCR